MDHLTALHRVASDGRTVLLAPRLGLFSACVASGDTIRPTAPLGTLRVLERRYLVIAPPLAAGIIELLSPLPARAVGYGDPLLALHSAAPLEVGPGAVERSPAAGGAAGQSVVCAPIHGIFYRRPAPGAPLYIEAGQTIRLGQTIGLIEVMKTFNPVLFEGDGLPAEARVIAVHVEDKTEVEAGTALLAVEPLSR